MPVTGQPFTDAVRVDDQGGLGSTSGRCSWWRERPPRSRRGDAILATFYLRTEKPQEGGVGETEFVFELNGSPVHQVGSSTRCRRGRGWTKVQVRFKAARPTRRARRTLIFRLGYEPETHRASAASRSRASASDRLGRCRHTHGADRQRERGAAAAAKAAAAAQAALPPSKGASCDSRSGRRR